MVRVLLVDDFDQWRQRVASMVRRSPQLTIIGTASDGLEAVRLAQELQPDLVLLDIGLPNLNGLDAAPLILQLSPRSKIIFLSQESSEDVVEEAFRRGAHGYVAKPDAATELLGSIETVVRGSSFVGQRFSELALSSAATHRDSRAGAHEVGFYSEERRLLEHLTEFVSAALMSKRAAIVLATETHRMELGARLLSLQLDTVSEIASGRLFMLDAEATLTAVMEKGMPDPGRFFGLLGDILSSIEKCGERKHGPNAIYGECVQLLQEQGNIEAAIAFEKLGNQVRDMFEVEILCGYSFENREDESNRRVIDRICAEHTLAHFR